MIYYDTENLMHLIYLDYINIIKYNNIAQFNWLILHSMFSSKNTAFANLYLHSSLLAKAKT